MMRTRGQNTENAMRFTALLATAATLMTVGAVSTPADARDGCGRGMYWNGWRCAPQHYRGGPEVNFYPGGYYQQPRRYYGEPRGYYRGGGPSERRGGGGCPRNYTVQDGECKPYTGR
jgi:hypothetical protein